VSRWIITEVAASLSVCLSQQVFCSAGAFTHGRLS